MYAQQEDPFVQKHDLVYTVQFDFNEIPECVNNERELIDKKESPIEPTLPKIKYPLTDCLVVNENSHVLPLKVVIDNNDKVQVRDTFWLYNVSSDTLYITAMQSTTKEFFSINPTLLPKQRTPLIFNGFLTPENYSFNTKYFNYIITLTDGSSICLGLVIPTISNHSTVYYRTDSTVNYTIAKQANERYSLVVFTYPNGYLRAVGTLQDMDTNSRVGNWLNFNMASMTSNRIVYSKEMLLSAFKDDGIATHNKFKLKVLEKGTWKEPITDTLKNQLRTFITQKTDKIVAYTDSTSYSFALSYKKLPVHTVNEFYLLKADDKKLKIGFYEIPFQLVKNQFTILFNNEYIKAANNKIDEFIDAYFISLQKQYPEITTFWMNGNQRCFSLQNLDNKTKGKVLKQLVRDSSISFVSQLFYTNRNQQNLNYCDNKVIAAIDIDTEYPERFWLNARIMGFSSIETDAGNNRFWLTFPSKLIDDDFFNAFKKLTRQKLVFFANFNSYIAPEKTKN
jgi:hypothetical protein